MEKRAVERFEMQIPATVFVEDGNLERVLTLETENISSRGALLHTDEPVPEGAKVEMELYLPLARLLAVLSPSETIKLTVKGTVVRTQRAAVAVEFDRNYQIRSFSRDPSMEAT
jgi:hypothetical protein